MLSCGSNGKGEFLCFCKVKFINLATLGGCELGGGLLKYKISLRIIILPHRLLCFP